MDTQAAEIIIALFAPLVVSLAKQQGWSKEVNGLVAIIVYILFGIGAVATSGQPLSLNDITPAVAIFVTVGTAAYTAFWRNVPQEAALTRATSIVR